MPAGWVCVCVCVCVSRIGGGGVRAGRPELAGGRRGKVRNEERSVAVARGRADHRRREEEGSAEERARADA